MADFVKPVLSRARVNPLSDDMVLFDLYLNALDVALAGSEIRSSLDEFGLSAATVRMDMVSEADRVLRSASREFAAYEEASAYEFGPSNADPSLLSRGSRRDLDSMLRLLLIGIASVGALAIVGGVASMAAWPGSAAWIGSLVWAGGTSLVVAAGAWASWRVVGTVFGKEILRGALGPDTSPGLNAARARLIAAVSETELLAHVRTFINMARERRFGHSYLVTSSPALSEIYDNANTIPTEVAKELDRLLDRFDGASVGVAGPRGSGKSTLIREYCESANSADKGYEENDWTSVLRINSSSPSGGDIRCLVAAPVNYVAQDFVLHLFAAFCRKVIGRYGARDKYRVPAVGIFWMRKAWNLIIELAWRAVFFGGLAAVLLLWRYDIAKASSLPASWVRYGGIALICVAAARFIWSAMSKIRRWVEQARAGDDTPLAASAIAHLNHVRYLMTFTSGWSGGANLPSGIAAQFSRGLSRAEQPLSYPELVDEFRRFTQEVATAVHRRGGRVFIGVDELDKIGSADQAEQFLNEIKGIFGIPHLYFMVSVSDDALTAFERRGLPLRDAFDSSFDEIIYVGPLSYAESRRLLYRRVIGLSEPYVALCHCLAGGLARELIRAARQVVRTATTLAAGSPSAQAKDKGGYNPLAYLLPDAQPQPPLLTLSSIAGAVVQDELRHKLRAVSHVLGSIAHAGETDFQDTLYETARHLRQEQPILEVIDRLADLTPAEPDAVRALRIDFAAYAYYCATLQEVFGDQLNDERMVQATSTTSSPGSFDALAAARNAFTVDTFLAWRLITQFRKDWFLDTRDPVGK